MLGGTARVLLLKHNLVMTLEVSVVWETTVNWGPLHQHPVL
jgi:hypothetical protein